MDSAALLRSSIRNFAVAERGVFLVISEDPVFLKMLQAALFKQIDIPHTCVSFVKSIEKLLATLPALLLSNAVPLIILELHHKGRSHEQYVRKIKEIAPDCKIIILTDEITRNSLALLYETGITSTIVKPLSMDTLIEKIANAIHPPAQLGKLIENARALLHAGNPQAALDLTDKILDLKPSSAAGLMLRGDALKELGKPSEALIQYQQAMSSAQFFIGPIQRLADYHAEQDNTEQQLYYLEKLDSLSPLNYERKIVMGKVNLQRGAPDTAHRHLTAAVRLATSGDARLLGEVATQISTHCMTDFPQACEQHLRTLLKHGNTGHKAALTEVWNTLGMSLRHQGRWSDAVQEFDKAISRVPDDENLYFNKALALTEGEQFAAAGEAVTKAIAHNPHFGEADATLCARIGRIFQLAGQPSKARHYYSRALQLKPDIPKVTGWLKALPPEGKQE